MFHDVVVAVFGGGVAKFWCANNFYLAEDTEVL